MGTSFFLFGPRGAGKTTWLKDQLPGAVSLDLLDSVLYTEILAHPVRLRNFIPPRDNPWVVIEERKTRFVLTGSSARSLRRKGTNLLAGRALTFRMHPLTWRELSTDAELATSLSSGHLPAALAAPDPRAFLKSYVQAYLREEVQQEGFARSVGAFSRFLETASFSQASLLNVAEVARECAAERKTVSGCFQVLEGLLLASTVPVFSRRVRRRLTAGLESPTLSLLGEHRC